jgi:hypothetical protein
MAPGGQSWVIVAWPERLEATCRSALRVLRNTLWFAARVNVTGPGPPGAGPFESLRRSSRTEQECVVVL